MQSIIDISYFLKTGSFGTVEIQDSIEKVIEKLGTPDGTLNVSKSFTGIHYSMYEFMFLNKKLESIQNDHFDPQNPNLMEFENDKIKINPEILKADKVKKMDEIKSELDRFNIEFEIIEYWGRKVIKTCGDVIIDFNDERWSDKENGFVKIKNENELELIGIRYYPKNR